MPALSFKEQFCPRVKNGNKRHSIRAKRKRAWKVGDKIALYYGQRTRHCMLLGRSKVVKVESIVIAMSSNFVLNDLPTGNDIYIDINGIGLNYDEATNLARLDGFTTLQAMARFWWKEHKKHFKAGKMFNGDVIHWAFPFESVE